MKKCLAFLMVLGLVSAVGCGSATTGKGKQGDKELTVNAADTISVTQGDSATFNVSVTRTKFEDDVKITVSELPDGVEAVDGETHTVAKGQSEVKITLKADKKAKVVEDHKIKIVAEGGGVTTDPDWIKITVKAGEDMNAKLKKWREDLNEKAKAAKSQADETLAKLNEQIKDASGDAKKNLVAAKESLEEQSKKLGEQLENLGEQTAEGWQEFQKNAQAAMTELGRRTQNAVQALKGKKN